MLKITIFLKGYTEPISLKCDDYEASHYDSTINLDLYYLEGKEKDDESVGAFAQFVDVAGYFAKKITE